MGIWEKADPWFLERLRYEFQFDPPTENGLDVAGTVDAILNGSLDVLVGLGGNFVDAVPDSEAVASAIRRLCLTVHVSTKLNRSHLCGGEEMFVLPVLSRMERDDNNGAENFVTVEDSMSKVHASRGSFDAKSPLCWSEVRVVTELARRVLADRPNAPVLDWEQCDREYAQIRSHISRVVDGFDDFEDRVRGDGFVLDNPARRREFRTPTGRAAFAIPSPPSPRAQPACDLVVQTLRSHDQYNTTVYGFSDRYRGLHGNRRILLVSLHDLTRLGLAERDVVDIESIAHDGSRWMREVTLIEYPTPPGCAAAYYPEANVLVPAHHRDSTSGTPASKSIPVRLHRVRSSPDSTMPGR